LRENLCPKFGGECSLQFCFRLHSLNSNVHASFIFLHTSRDVAARRADLRAELVGGILIHNRIIPFMTKTLIFQFSDLPHCVHY